MLNYCFKNRLHSTRGFDQIVFILLLSCFIILQSWPRETNLAIFVSNKILSNIDKIWVIMLDKKRIFSKGKVYCFYKQKYRKKSDLLVIKIELSKIFKKLKLSGYFLFKIKSYRIQ